MIVYCVLDHKIWDEVKFCNIEPSNYHYFIKFAHIMTHHLPTLQHGIFISMTRINFICPLPPIWEYKFEEKVNFCNISWAIYQKIIKPIWINSLDVSTCEFSSLHVFTFLRYDTKWTFATLAKSELLQHFSGQNV